MRQPCSQLLALAATASMMLACSRSDQPASSGDDDAQAKLAQVTDAKTIPDGVQLLSAGRTPHATPRWKFREGQTQSAELTTQFKIRTTVGIQPLPESVSPPVTYEIRVETKEVTPDGTGRFNFEVIKATVQPSSTASPEIVDSMRRYAAKMVGVRGSYSADALGRIQDFEYSDSPATQAADPSSMETLERLIDTTLVPLPEAEIGKGAKWTYANSFQEGGATVRQASTFELTELDKDSIHTQVSTRREADRQRIGTPVGGTNEQAYELLSLESNGTGRAEAELHALFPKASTLSTKATMKMLLPGEKDQPAQSMQMQLDTQSSVRAK